MTQDSRSAATGRKKIPTLTPRHSAAPPATGPAFQQYLAAVQLVQQGRFEKALAAFEKLLPTAPPEILERCRMYVQTCKRQMESRGLTFQTLEERYDYAVSQLNSGYYEEADEQLHGILEDAPEADYAYYGLALLHAITGRLPECLEYLSRAIELNPKNRLQARSDTDFQSMADDPRFTELLYPEIP